MLFVTNSLSSLRANTAGRLGIVLRQAMTLPPRTASQASSPDVDRLGRRTDTATRLLTDCEDRPSQWVTCHTFGGLEFPRKNSAKVSFIDGCEQARVVIQGQSTAVKGQ